jgi:hypothetical protein
MKACRRSRLAPDQSRTEPGPNPVRPWRNGQDCLRKPSLAGFYASIVLEWEGLPLDATRLSTDGVAPESNPLSSNPPLLGGGHGFRKRKKQGLLVR